MRRHFACVVGTLLVLGVETAPAGAQSIHNDTIAVMKSVGTYLRVTYGPRLTISSVAAISRATRGPDGTTTSIPFCGWTCTWTPATGRELAAVAESGKFPLLSKVPVVCSSEPQAHHCRFASTDVVVNPGEPVITNDHALVPMGIAVNEPHGPAIHTENGTLALEKRGVHWMVTGWHVDIIFD
jgi:hypothetical protein